METKKLETLAIDSLWYLLYEQVDFFMRKIDVVCNIYNECLDLSSVSSPNKDKVKEEFAKFVRTPFANALLAVKMATKFNNEDSSTIFENGILNLRGFARIRVSMGLINNIEVEPDNSDYNYVLSTILKNFNYVASKHGKKSMFEVMCEFINNRPNIQSCDERMVANSFLQCIEYAEVVNSLDYCFDSFLAKELKAFALSPAVIREKNFYKEVPYKIAKEVTKRFDRRDYYSSNRIIASDLARRILNNYNS